MNGVRSADATFYFFWLPANTSNQISALNVKGFPFSKKHIHHKTARALKSISKPINKSINKWINQ